MDLSRSLLHVADVAYRMLRNDECGFSEEEEQIIQRNIIYPKGVDYISNHKGAKKQTYCKTYTGFVYFIHALTPFSFKMHKFSKYNTL